MKMMIADSHFLLLVGVKWKCCCAPWWTMEKILAQVVFSGGRGGNSPRKIALEMGDEMLSGNSLEFQRMLLV